MGRAGGMISGSNRFPSGVEAFLQPHELGRLDGFHRRRKLCNAVKRVRCESRMIKSCFQGAGL
jgi:hypothetical protein